MKDEPHSPTPQKFRSPITEAPLIRLLLIGLAVLCMGLFFVLPMAVVFVRLRHGAFGPISRISPIQMSSPASN